IGEKIVVRPPWEEYEPATGDLVIALDPGAAFGTGTHASTAMCARFLEELPLEGAVVFDLGTGSGILTLAAAKLGAAKVVAVDNDKVAVRVATENVALNKTGTEITVRQGDLLQGFEGQADIIIANIVADVIIKILPVLENHLAPGGSFIAGGIISERLSDVIAALKEKTSLVPDQVAEEGGWATILARRAAEL
ncbi:MAG: 50S ribosomal protein L11 methyltransferase, partial [Sporomusaceae bacterium]|nr:50S ribosomal protein L11 methyltransferase [Sporomusaceae bacterium]